MDEGDVAWAYRCFDYRLGSARANRPGRSRKGYKVEGYKVDLEGIDGISLMLKSMWTVRFQWSKYYVDGDSTNLQLLNTLDRATLWLFGFDGRRV